MIKTLNPKIKLPNYDVLISFIDDPTEDIGDPKQIRDKCGSIDLTDYSITILKVDPEFDEYNYILFLCGAIMFVQDISFTSAKFSSLAVFLYYIFTHNDIKAKCKELKKNKEIEFEINTPILKPTVKVKNDPEHPGSVSIVQREIIISNSVSHQLKPVIFIHELIEWVNSLFALKLTHSSIQSFSEILVYIIMNNDFIS